MLETTGSVLLSFNDYCTRLNGAVAIVPFRSLTGETLLSVRGRKAVPGDRRVPPNAGSSNYAAAV